MSHPARIAQNLGVFDFTLSPTTLGAIEGLTTGFVAVRTRTRSTSGSSASRSPNEVDRRQGGIGMTAQTDQRAIALASPEEGPVPTAFTALTTYQYVTPFVAVVSL
jgi:hypothetical protein